VATVFGAVGGAIRRTWQINAELRDQIPPVPRLRWLNLCCILLIVATTALLYQDGLSRGMNRVVPDGVDAVAQAVGVHISEKFHGTTGYVGRTEVLHELFRSGFTGRQNYLDPLGIQYPANVEMPDLLDKAIQNAINLKNLPTDATFANKRLYAPQANDPGLIDYMKWSFELFGYRVESLYYLYFLILTTAVALYLICFYAAPLPLVALSGLLVAFLLMMDSRYFAGVLTRSVHNQRFLGTLCFVSFLHLVFVFLLYRRPTPIRVVTTALQVALFTFVMFTRSSAVWMVMAFALVGVLIAFNWFDRAAAGQKGLRSKVLLSWPALLLAFGVGGSAIYKSSVIHPMYTVGIFLPYHMIWHNAYIGLGLHPDWTTKGDQYGSRPVPEPMSDNVGWTAAALEAVDRYGLPEAYLYDGEIGGLPSYKTALHDKLLKERFFRFMAEHPWYTVELFLWYKPKTFVMQYTWMFGDYSPRIWTLICLVAFLVVGVVCRQWLTIPRHARLLVTTTGVIIMVMSLAPVMWTYPIHHVSGESFLALTTFAVLLAPILLSKLWDLVRPVVRRSS
jgi:hypothetical protein